MTAEPELTEARARADALCGAFEMPQGSATVKAPEIVEASGIAASRQSAGLLWAHNDSGDTARAIALSLTGDSRGVFDISGAEARDWEDMAIGPGPLAGEEYLYFGDIGDNDAVRSEIVVYRAVEPLVGSDAVALEAERVVLRYADTPHDAETLIVDPMTGDLIIVTKEIIAGDSGVYVASADALATGSATLARAGTITKATLTTPIVRPETASALVRGVGWLPTGGDISRDGALIVVRTYASVWVWPREPDQSVAEALAGEPCEGPSALEAQGEAIAFLTDGDGYFTVSEGANPVLYRFGIE